MAKPNARRRAAQARKGHEHSPPVNKTAIVRLNAMRGMSLTSLTSGDLHGQLHLAKAKSPFHGANAPAFGAGQGALKPRVIPADKKRFAGEKPKHFTVDQITDAKRLRYKVKTRFKAPAHELRLQGPALNVKLQPKPAAIGEAEIQRIKNVLGLKR